MTSLKKILSLVILLLALVVVIGIALLLSAQSRAKQEPTSPIPELVSTRKSGDYTTALAQYQAILQDPNSTAEQKAIATYSIAGAEFHATGDISTRLQDIKNLKQVVLDTTLSAPTRAIAANVLAASYGDSGRDTTVFAELFKDAPFNESLAPGNPGLSVRHLYEMSYGIYPSPEAAIHIAKWYADKAVLSNQLDATTTQSYITSAEEYLKKGEVAAAQRAKENPQYASGVQYYVWYQFWYATVVGRLAQSGVAPYTTQYRDEFNKYIDFTNKIQDVQALENLYYARFYYAQVLKADDAAAATTQLDLLAQELDALKEPTRSGFVRLMQNAFRQTDDPNRRVLRDLAAISPNFKTTMNRLVANSSTEGN